jgi:serine/threonine protein kinase
MGMKKPATVVTAFDSYKLGKILGQGGSGYVYAATDTAGSEVAVKLLNPERATEDKRRRFKNEYLFCSRCDHENVIKVTEYGMHAEDIPFLVMPRYDNPASKAVKPALIDAKFNAFLKVLHGVEAAHLSGVVHRDLKPENILCSDDLSNVVVADFGIARFDDEEYYTAVETKAADRLANFKYRAPEQMERRGVISPRTDIFSLGLILNEFFTSRIPAGTGYKSIKDVAEEYAYLDPIVARMIDQEPERRFSSIDELKKEISKQGELQVSRQKLAQLDAAVVQVDQPDDPLIADPMKVVNVDWNGGNATIELNHKPTADWLNAYNSMGNFSYNMSFHPHHSVQFYGNSAVFSCQSRQLQDCVNFFKGWLETANKAYEAAEQQRLQKQENQLRENLKRQKIEEEERQSALSDLTF